jgi:hypothetical protein
MPTLIRAPDLIPISRAVAVLREAWGRPAGNATIIAWHQRGLLAADGRRVHLRLTKIAGTWFVRQRDFEDFLRALTVREGESDGVAAPHLGRSPTEERRGEAMRT